jgi:hypothetical protein
MDAVPNSVPLAPAFVPACPPCQVSGTGPEGRVTKGDVLAYLDALSSAGPGTIGEDVAHDVPTTGGPVCLPLCVFAAAAASVQRCCTCPHAETQMMLGAAWQAGSVPACRPAYFLPAWPCACHSALLQRRQL